jgi:arginyl-tRNA synthetase
VHCNLLVGKYTAIKKLVYSYLLASVDRFNYHQQQQSIIKNKIPLHKVRDDERILYISGVALKLSKSHNLNSMEIAETIASQVAATCKEYLYVRIVAPGWIHLELTDYLLINWLQHLTVIGLPDGVERGCKEIGHPSRLFAIQYAHARCCSLILQAQREGLINFKENLPENWQERSLSGLVSVQIPWLNSQKQLILNHSAERCLISELMGAVDNLIFPNDNQQMNWEKLGLDVSQAFEGFWSQCRIWGEVKTNFPELTQARLGLVLATQTVLRCLLVTKLGIVAPFEI